MATPNVEAATLDRAPASPASSQRRRWVILLASAVVIVLAAVLITSTAKRTLTPKEQLLLGAWEWQSGPGAMVLYFDDRGTLTYSQPPFTTFHFERWYIDEDDRIHFTVDGKGLIRTVRRMVAPQTEVYTIQFTDGSPTLTTNGTKKVLVPYTGNATETLKAAR